MYRTLLIIVIICFPFLCQAQNGYWAWANTAPDMGTAEAKKVVTDNDGNVLVTGSFEGSINFGSISLSGHGNSDVFIVKYNNQGHVLWAESFGGAHDDEGVAVAIDNSDNVYITGIYSGIMQIGSLTLDSIGESDVFIVKYNNKGVVQWAKKGGSVYKEMPQDIKVDNAGNIYIGGMYGVNYGTSSPDSAIGYFGDDTLLSHYGSNIYLAKYDGTGNSIWSKSIGDVSNDEGLSSIFPDENGNILLGGSFRDTIEFDKITLTSSSVGFVVSNMFIAKYDSSGSAIWAKNVSGSNTSGMSTAGAIPFCFVTSTTVGDVYVTGTYFNCDMLFPGTTLKSNANGNIYLAKYSNSGAFQWAKKAIIYYGRSNGIATDDKQNIYITGSLSGENRIGEDSLTGFGGENIFIGKYDKDGKAISGAIAGGTFRDYANSITVDKDGVIYLAGVIGSNTATFGSYTVNSSNGKDMFVAKYQSYPTGITYTLASSSAHINIYPNPVQNQLVIEGAANGTEVQVLNVLGQQVHNGSIISSKTTINTSALQPGMYIIHLTDNAGKTITRRVVKE